MSRVRKIIAAEVIRLTSEDIERRFYGDPDWEGKARGVGLDQTANHVVIQGYESQMRGSEIDYYIHIGAESGRELQERDRRWAAIKKESYG